MRLHEGNYLAIHNGRMIEVEADNEEEAYIRAIGYYRVKRCMDVSRDNLVICRIPTIIGVLYKDI